MTALTTAQRLIDFRKELSTGNGFGEELLNDLIRDASRVMIADEGLVTRLETAPAGSNLAPQSAPEGVGESKSPA